MINNEILSFVKEQVARGTSRDQIKNLLVTQGGWDEKDVDEAFDTVSFAGTSYSSALKNTATGVNPNTEKTLSGGGMSSPAPFSSGAQASAPRMTTAFQSTARPASAAGFSRVEQPKVMEPSDPNAFRVSASSPMGMAAGAQSSDGLGRLREKVSPGASVAPSFPPVGNAAPNVGMNPPLDQFRVAPLNKNMGGGMSARPAAEPFAQPEPRISPVIKEPLGTLGVAPVSGVTFGEETKTPVVNTAPSGMAGGMTAPAMEVSIKPVSSAASFQNISRSFGAVSSAPAPAVQTTPVSAPSLVKPTDQPVAVFPKIDAGAPRMMPTPAQLAALQAQKKQGNRFFLGFMMFLIGLLIGGILMNAYMHGYLNKSAFNGVKEKIMGLIGLDTPAPIPVTDAPIVPDDGS